MGPVRTGPDGPPTVGPLELIGSVRRASYHTVSRLLWCGHAPATVVGRGRQPGPETGGWTSHSCTVHITERGAGTYFDLSLNDSGTESSRWIFRSRIRPSAPRITH